MVLIKFFIFVFTCACIVAYCDQQYIRYNQFVKICEDERESDLLLTRNACKDQRLMLHDKCADARFRLTLSIEKCARTKLFATSEIVRVWSTMTNGYLRVLGFALPLSFVLVYYIIGGWFDERKTNNLMAKQAEFINKFYLNGPARQQQQQVGLLEYGPRKKRKTYSARRKRRIEIIDSDDDEFDDTA